ncbi:MAG: metallophosphatase [Smithella sp. SDB]|nr:MAG: metallophosphatase [Smithella sp. SDB]
MNKIFAIGDIHGCLEKLKELMSRIDIDGRNDTLIFIGDFIDRGRFSKEVIDYILRLQSKYKKMICLLGNHERMFLNYLEGVDEDMYLVNGGINTLHSYGISLYDDIKKRKSKIPADHQSFFQSLLPYYEKGKYIFVHAGLNPDVPLAEQGMYDLLWVRYEFIESKKDMGKIVIFGHTPVGEKPLIRKNKIGIDTGVVYGGKLTCIELPDLKIYQA